MGGALELMDNRGNDNRSFDTQISFPPAAQGFENAFKLPPKDDKNFILSVARAI